MVTDEDRRVMSECISEAIKVILIDITFTLIIQMSSVQICSCSSQITDRVSHMHTTTYSVRK